MTRREARLDLKAQAAHFVSAAVVASEQKEAAGGGEARWPTGLVSVVESWLRLRGSAPPCCYADSGKSLAPPHAARLDDANRHACVLGREHGCHHDPRRCSQERARVGHPS